MKYELIIIGAGAAGISAAVEARYLNKSVLLIEKEELGGTCLNVGCIPTKALIHKSEEYYNALRLNDFEVKVKDSFYKNLMDTKDSVIEKQKRGLEYLIKHNEITFIKGVATLVNENTIEVNKEKYIGDNILICTGSIPLVPNIEGINNCVFSDEILSADYEKINSIIIIGGGLIGVEIATIFSNLGKQVTIIEAQDRLLTNMDSDVSASIKRILKKDGVSFYLNSLVTKIEKNCVFIGEKKVVADTIFCAIGRVSNTREFDPKSLIIKEKGSIVVDNEYKTNIKNIYAVGDCINLYKLAHFASALAIYTVDTMFNKYTNIVLDNVPSCLYSKYEVSSVGKLDYQDDICVKHSLLSNARSLINEENKGFIKLIFKKDGYFKGATIMCSRASDMINIFVSALNNGYNIDDMLKDIYPHPTFSEGIKEALIEVKHQFDKLYN